MSKPEIDWKSPEHDPDAYRLSLVEHLEELRTRIVRSIMAIVVGWIVGWMLEGYLYGFLTDRATKAIVPVLPKDAKYSEVLLHAPDAFLIKLKLSFMIGVILAFPVVVYQLWAFIAPGLKPHEQAPFKRLAPFSIMLFLIGASFCWMIMPAAFAWFASYMDSFPGVSLNQEAGFLATLTLKSLMAFGIGFQLPLVVYGLGAVGLLSAETLFKHWRHAASIIFILAAVVTPSNDPMSMLMMAIPLTVLFMISVYAVKFTQTKRGLFLESAEDEASEA